MILKRKRSDSEISCGSSLLSSPSNPNSMAIDNFQLSPNRVATSSLFPSRTRKRHRDNRPSETEVHQHTLSLLFSAQQTPQSTFQQSTSHFNLPAVESLPSTNQPAQRSNLHSFWAIPGGPRQESPGSNFSSSTNTPMTSSANNMFFLSSNCEDCEASLSAEDSLDAMDVDMMDSGNGEDFACTSCRKMVCHGCAVSNLGAERKCLMCAGKKQWVGGLGWVDSY
ncbi:hypothetical protein HYFRA_00004979 [Hymenoscyphus fraxineus]|uniref:Uncharacterized protein n=1 Tax=Hymenoscyphus fraxineus TaxID=746836 RepID=A0A9N9KLT8_9HELO|nr:hypothetical protein HYFRA_00004979 [Hymenoscyphus fraxineus]